LSLAQATVLPVPEISRFYGIVIAIFFAERRHIGRPHFHATYAEQDVSIDIESLEVLAGTFPAKGLRLVKRWAEMHTAELRDNWERAQRGEPLESIEPLP
jgi:hypothetical protein